MPASRLIALISFAFCLSALAESTGEKQFQTKFRVKAESMIIVPVTINGSGPFDFLLDTGSTGTVIDQKLAAELKLPDAGNINLVTPQGSALVPRVRADSLSMAGATVGGLKLSAVNHYADLLPNVRGSLGEDFLQNFDLLIDNRHHLIQFESAPGPLAAKLTGEHIPFCQNRHNHGELTHNRIQVIGHIFELGEKDLILQLDSGTQYFVLFVRHPKPAFVSEPSLGSVSSDVFGSSIDFDAQTFLGLRLGKALLSNPMVITPTVNIPGMDVDGFLPTSLFRSIFISHSGGFIILNPSAKDPSVEPALAERPALAQIAPQPLLESKTSPRIREDYRER